MEQVPTLSIKMIVTEKLTLKFSEFEREYFLKQRPFAPFFPLVDLVFLQYFVLFFVVENFNQMVNNI